MSSVKDLDKKMRSKTRYAQIVLSSVEQILFLSGNLSMHELLLLYVLLVQRVILQPPRPIADPAQHRTL